VKQPTLQRGFALRVQVTVPQHHFAALMLARAATVGHVQETGKAHLHVPVTRVGQDSLVVSKSHARGTATPCCATHAFPPLVVGLVCLAMGTQETTFCQVNPVICCR
jgi:hypothetical protein